MNIVEMLIFAAASDACATANDRDFQKAYHVVCLFLLRELEEGRA